MGSLQFKYKLTKKGDVFIVKLLKLEQKEMIGGAVYEVYYYRGGKFVGTVATSSMNQAYTYASNLRGQGYSTRIIRQF